MSMVDEQWEFLQDVALLILEARKKGIKLSGGELFRTPEQQEIYLQTGKTKTSNSYHLKRLAIDFNFFINGELDYNSPLVAELGTYWESLNPNKNKWGGNFRNFKDTPHFERRA